jgi:hypothetical protein
VPSPYQGFGANGHSARVTVGDVTGDDDLTVEIEPCLQDIEARGRRIQNDTFTPGWLLGKSFTMIPLFSRTHCKFTPPADFTGIPSAFPSHPKHALLELKFCRHPIKHG